MCLHSGWRQLDALAHVQTGIEIDPSKTVRPLLRCLSLDIEQDPSLTTPEILDTTHDLRGCLGFHAMEGRGFMRVFLFVDFDPCKGLVAEEIAGQMRSKSKRLSFSVDERGQGHVHDSLPLT